MLEIELNGKCRKHAEPCPILSHNSTREELSAVCKNCGLCRFFIIAFRGPMHVNEQTRDRNINTYAILKYVKTQNIVGKMGKQIEHDKNRCHCFAGHSLYHKDRNQNCIEPIPPWSITNSSAYVRLIVYLGNSAFKLLTDYLRTDNVK